MVEETQIMPNCSDDELAMVWWIPQEFWIVSMEQDPSIPRSAKEEMLALFKDIAILCVVQSELTDMGSTYPYSKAKVLRGMTVNYTDSNGKSRRLVPKEQIDEDLDYLLNTVVSGIMEGIVGNFGKNMHYYVFDNRSTSSSVFDNQSSSSSVKVDPFKEGMLNVNLTGEGGGRLKADIQMPLDCLFVPRICPNGKEAHISWSYCPWTGKKLN